MKNFTKWVRGKESLILKSPRPVPTALDVIGLGGTVAGYFYFKNLGILRPRLLW